MNNETKLDLNKILQTFLFHGNEKHLKIEEKLRMYHAYMFTNNISNHFINGLIEIESSDDINGFLEIVLKTIDSVFSYYDTRQEIFINIVEKINNLFRFRQYMDYVDNFSYDVVVYINQYTKEEIHKVLKNDNEVEVFIKRALKELKKVTGTIVHLASKGLEEFFKTEIKLNGNTLGAYIVSLKKDSRYLSLNEYTKNVVDQLLEIIKKSKNKGSLQDILVILYLVIKKRIILFIQ